MGQVASLVLELLHSAYKRIKHEEANSRSPALPRDIIHKIMQQHLDLIDRVRLSLICKDWRSIANRNDGVSTPWLVFHCRSQKGPIIYNLAKGKLSELRLPELAWGGFSRGSSKGWLFMITNDRQWLLLVNPLSRAVLQLPPLKTIPSAGSDPAACISHIEVSSSDPSDCTVVVIVNTSQSLTFCRPSDKSWSIFERKSPKDNIYYNAILFCDMTLYAFYGVYDGLTEEKGLSSFILRTEANHETELKLVAEWNIPTHERVRKTRQIFSTYTTVEPETFSCYMAKSSINGKPLLVLANVNKYIYYKSQEDLAAQRRQYTYLQTEKFRVFEIDTETGRLRRLDRLDDQVLFLSTNGSVSLPAEKLDGFQGNSIYFTEHQQYDDESEILPHHDYGVFYLDKSSISRPFPRSNLLVQPQVFWFDPHPTPTQCRL